MSETINKTQKNILNTQIVIIGGGLVGQALALALAPYLEHITIVDRIDMAKMGDDNFDSRALALSYNALCILKSLGLWQQLSHACEAINMVHVSNKGLPGRVILEHTKENKSCLGAICAFPKLYSALYQALLTKSNIHLISPVEIKTFSHDKNQLELISDKLGQVTVNAELVIACDGARSKIRDQLNIEVDHTDYRSYAAVCNVQLNRSHHNTAYERFYDDGIVAMLPMKNQVSACVYTFPHQQKEQIISMDDKALCEHLQQLFGYRLGRFIKVSKRDIFPLHLVVAEKLYVENTLLFGNAAHFLHPVAGQGFNLCLRDIAVFADLVDRYGIGCDNSTLLEAFESARLKDHKQTIWASNSLVRLFSNPSALVKASRSIGLHMTERLSITKSLINKMMMGDMIGLPTLAKTRINSWEI